MLLVLQTLLLLMIQILLMDDLVLLLQLEHFLRIHLGGVVATCFCQLTAIVWRFEKFDIFHFLVISRVVLYLALTVMSYFILTTSPLNSSIVKSLILEQLHLTMRIFLSFTESIWV